MNRPSGGREASAEPRQLASVSVNCRRTKPPGAQGVAAARGANRERTDQTNPPRQAPNPGMPAASALRAACGAEPKRDAKRTQAGVRGEGMMAVTGPHEEPNEPTEPGLAGTWRRALAGDVERTHGYRDTD